MTNELPVPPLADMAPTDAALTTYDRQHLAIYLRLLDAEHAHADWEHVAQTVLKLDTKANKLRARAVWESHLARAHWLTNNGYRLLLEGRLKC